MKVLHLDLAPMFRGGQRQALLLHRQLLQAGVHSRLVVDADGRLRAKAEADGVEGIVPLRLSHARPDAIGRLLSLPQLATLLRRERADVVHFHEPASLMYVPFVRDALAVHTRRVSFPIKRRSIRLKYRHIDLHVGVSDEISDYLRGLGLSPVETVRSAIDLDRFAHPPAHRPLAGRPGFRLLYVGAFHKMKGTDVLLEAYHALATEDPAVELHLVGDGELLPSFRRGIDARGLGARTFFHGFRDDTESFLCDADAVLVTSTRGEGSNGIIKEAMAAGRPPIASDLACNRELIKDGVDGLLYANGDATALAATVRRLLRGDVRCAADVLRAKAAGFSDRHMGDRYLALYRHHLQAVRSAA